ncbi:ABC transporter substrate-binding protein [Natrialbaceae archaeon GCM10025810]|uniref:ABC transporter substrate-binding protein n=1 Tax=Halovalidus salilacus TaxID=3075124 RepID=UPI0036168C57
MLAAASAGLVGSLAGCTDSLQEAVTGSHSDQLSITILTLPAEHDRQGIQIASRLEKNLQRVGVNVMVEPRSQTEFLRSILLDHEFDCYVGRHPGGRDPDFLYETLHSTFVTEAGWQNPFGFASAPADMLTDDAETSVDGLLEEQRTVSDPEERQEVVDSLLRTVAQIHPFVPICIPHERRLARTDRFETFSDRLETHHPSTRLAYLDLEQPEDEETVTLTATITDTRPTRNLNPLAAVYRHQGVYTDLLYDSLAYYDVDEDEMKPWLAEGWTWTDGAIEVTLRSDCRFHDDEERVTAEDVAFTYEFLADTTLGERDVPLPAPRYRSEVSAIDVDEIEYRDRTIRLPIDANRTIGERALAVPILPRHVWESEVDERLEDGARPRQGKWGIVTSGDIPRIGSGPYQFADWSNREHVTFERFDDHFTLRDDVDLPEPTLDELVFWTEPNGGTAVDQIEAGNADVTTSILRHGTVGDVPEDDEISHVEYSPADENAMRWTFYHVGFNLRNEPFSDPYFRRNVARLIDREYIVEEVFSGDEYATPVLAPIAGEWVPPELEWDGEDPYAPYFRSEGEPTDDGNDDDGENGETMRLDVERAKRAFERTGYEYDEDGEYLVNP